MVKLKLLEMINLENFYNLGYEVIDNILSNEEIEILKEKLNSVHKTQKKEFNEEKLKLIGEENIIRFPFLYDSYFLNLIYNSQIQNIVKTILGDYAILSLQNSIIIPPHTSHHQSFYHRDIIHQDFTSSKPLGINIYYCLDNYNEKTGGTCFISSSHKLKKFPEIYTETTPQVRAGSIIIFDSMIYHKAGINNSDEYRYGINHMFTLPFIKQQMDLPQILGEDYTDDIKLRRLLGYNSREYKSIFHFRNERINKLLK